MVLLQGLDKQGPFPDIPNEPIVLPFLELNS